MEETDYRMISCREETNVSISCGHLFAFLFLSLPSSDELSSGRHYGTSEKRGLFGLFLFYLTFPISSKVLCFFFFIILRVEEVIVVYLDTKVQVIQL